MVLFWYILQHCDTTQYSLVKSVFVQVAIHFLKKNGQKSFIFFIMILLHLFFASSSPSNARFIQKGIFQFGNILQIYSIVFPKKLTLDDHNIQGIQLYEIDRQVDRQRYRQRIRSQMSPSRQTTNLLLLHIGRLVYTFGYDQEITFSKIYTIYLGE